MSDMFCAVSAGFVDTQLCIDLTQLEQSAGGAYIPVVIKARSEEVVFMQLDSKLSLEYLEDALNKSIEGCRLVKAYLDSAIRQSMLNRIERMK